MPPSVTLRLKPDRRQVHASGPAPASRPPPGPVRPSLHDCLRAAVAEARRLAADAPSRSAEAMLVPFLDTLPFAALVADSAGRYVAINRLACALTGYSAAELLRLSVWQLTPDAGEREAEVLWRAFLQQEAQSGQYALRVSNGGVVRVDYVSCAHLLKGFHLSLLVRTTDVAANGSSPGDV